ncbi:MAG: adenylosuccinate lyase, partial [Clostridia bacterium]|nr:adenylosuccinate lyase [Clostridia bacterium]
IIRRCSMEATAKMKNGEECDLLSRLSSESEFSLSKEEMEHLLDPNLYIGRCPEQVMILIEKINSLITDISTGSSEITL